MTAPRWCVILIHEVWQAWHDYQGVIVKFVAATEFCTFETLIQVCPVSTVLLPVGFCYLQILWVLG